jgi:hypothetical protein
MRVTRSPEDFDLKPSDLPSRVEYLDLLPGQGKTHWLIQHVIVPYLVHVSGVQEKPLTSATVWARKAKKGYEPYPSLMVAVPTSLLADQLEEDLMTALQSLIEPEDVEAIDSILSRYHRAVRDSTEPVALEHQAHRSSPMKYVIAKQLRLAQEVPGRVLVVSHAALTMLPLHVPGLSNSLLLVDEVLDTREGVNLTLTGDSVLAGVTLKRPLSSYASLVSSLPVAHVEGGSDEVKAERGSLKQTAESVARVHRVGDKLAPPVASYYVATLRDGQVPPHLEPVSKLLVRHPRSVLLLGVTPDLEDALQSRRQVGRSRFSLTQVMRGYARTHLPDTIISDVRVHTADERPAAPGHLFCQFIP